MMKNKLLFILIFVVIGLLAMQVPVNVLAGSKVKFTLFDLYAPIAGAFLGTGFGVLAVLIMEVINLFSQGLSMFDKGSIIRLFPTLFAVVYFCAIGKSKFANKKLLLIPLAAILSFNLNPVGRAVWFYSMFWLIPIAVWPLREKSLVLRSLGTTFSAHAVGGAIWIWVFNLPATVWISLIPVVILERSIFALGISASYILMNNILGYLLSKKIIPRSIAIDKGYLIKS